MPDYQPPGPAADRNLLFGILALQADLIGRDALIAAMNAWTVNKTTPLGQILLDQGALDADGHVLVEALVRRSLARHGGNAEQSLAALSSLGSARDRLQQIVDPDLQASLAHVGPTPALDPEATVDRHSPAHANGEAVRYRVIRPHAKGGLGEVFVAEDTELHREVALKEIHKERADDPHSRGRFLLEAEITGGLEHPGIVPVYGLGQYADGRPFYAMRFVKGDNLKEAIRRFHEAEQPGRDAGERSLAFRELLGRFVDVCQAVAYAHSRGILHRDLKPGNVMLGKYGETLVVDWGLAKPVGRAESLPADGEATLRPSSGSAAGATQAGAAVGTPAYMSPEQAAGRLGELGPASDIYSLGATLYALLTGRVPFPGTDQGDILQRVQRGELVPPRRVKPAVPAALEAVCLKAMALRPHDRYQSALALAADVEHWLADEPVSAWREPVRVRLGRWARRHKPAVAAVAAAVLVALLLGGAGVLWVQRQAEERERAVAVALAKAVDLQRQARWAEARAVLEQAESRLGEGGPEDLRRRLEQALRDLDLVARLDAIRLKSATWVKDRFDYATAARDYAAAFQEAGLGAVGEDPGKVAVRVRGSAVRAELVAVLDDWATLLGPPEPKLRWVLAVARLADPDPWRDRVRKLRVWNNKRRLGRLVQGSRAGQVPPRFGVAVGQRLHRLGGDAEAPLRAAQRRLPGDFWVNFDLGHALGLKKQWGEAVGYYRAALAVRPDTPSLLNNLGNVLAAQGQLREAVRTFRRALALDPRFAYAHNGLGNALKAQGRLKQAMREYRRFLALDPKSAEARTNLGTALKAQGQLTAAVREYRRAIALDPKLALAHSNLGTTLKSLGRLREAVKECRRAIALDPKLALAHLGLGTTLSALGKHTEAVRSYRRAIALDPKDVKARTNLGTTLSALGKHTEAVRAYRRAIALDLKDAKTYYNLGNSLRALGQLPEAVRAYRRAIALHPNYATAHTNLGIVLAKQGQLKEAVREYRRAIAIDPKLAQAHGALGLALLKLGQFAEARQATRRCLRLLPARHPQRQLAAQMLRQCRQLLALDRKLAAILQGEAKPDSPVEQLNLAILCQRFKKRYAAAARLYGDAFAVQPGLAALAGHRYNAACCAALAVAGKGMDAGQLEAKEKARLRGQALTWLRADLVLRAKQLTSDKPPERQAAQKALQHWQKDPDLAGVRDQEPLAKLPEAERKEWAKLWAEVGALLKKAGPKKEDKAERKPEQKKTHERPRKEN
jgi:serine/threonine-protein kinase